MNELRRHVGERIANVWKVINRQSSDKVTIETYVDLITDAMHAAYPLLCERGDDIDDLILTARMHFDAEQKGEE
jgi:hypothetical protein